MPDRHDLWGTVERELVGEFLTMQELTIQELAIVVAVKAIDPTLITPDFLTMTQIVPGDWQVLGQPSRGYEGAQITYQSGVSVLAQPQRVSFAELVLNKELTQVAAPQVALNFTKVLANLELVGVGVNFRGYVSFAGRAEAARRFMFSHLLALGEWLDVGDAPVQGAVNLGYTFADKRLNLAINEAAMQSPDHEVVPIVLFSGNFDYDLQGLDPTTGHGRTQEILAQWQQDLARYREVVGKFQRPDTILNVPTYSA